MQDASASICITKLIPIAFYGGLSPPDSWWARMTRRILAAHVGLSSVLVNSWAVCCLEVLGHTTNATVVLQSTRFSLALDPASI